MENDSAVTIAQQESGWTMSAPADAVQLGTFQVAGRGATAVFELPSSYAGGVALRSSDGARFPQSGWLPLSAAPQSRRNWVDALILIAVITGALLGFRAGAAATGVQLLVLAAIVAGVRVLGSLMPPSADPRQFTSMLAVCAGVGVAGIVAHLAIYRVAGPYMLRVRGDIANRAVGVPLGGARMLIAAAMLLALGSDLAMFDAFYASVRESQAGTWLVELWRSWIS
jgi:uncharacterized membrane protein required for colicin V production